MNESCSVSLELTPTTDVDLAEIAGFVGVEPTRVRRHGGISRTWELNLKGPSPVNATRVANDLARELLTRVGAAARSTEAWARMRREYATEVRFHFQFGTLLSFSYELEPAVVRDLALLGCPISCTHHDGGDQSSAHRFGGGPSPDEGCTVALRISGETFDPSTATSLLGIQPSREGRRGDAAAPRSKRILSRSFWLLEGASARSHEADSPIAALLGQVPTTSDGWTTLSRGYDVRVLIAFQVRHMMGHWELASSTTRRLADCGCGLDMAFYDWGPQGADLLA
jgi:hypothetical protein